MTNYATYIIAKGMYQVADEKIRDGRVVCKTVACYCTDEKKACVIANILNSYSKDLDWEPDPWTITEDKT